MMTRPVLAAGIAISALLETFAVAADRRWTGSTDNKWDTTTLNWVPTGGGGAVAYQEGDNVYFDDSATGSTELDLTALRSPGALTFTNGAKTYTLNGTGGIGGSGGLTMQGTGRVILTGVNSYSGATLVNSGVLQIGTGSSASLVGTSVTIAASGTVELNLTGAYGSPTSGAGMLRTVGAGSFNLTAGAISGGLGLNIAGIAAQIIGVGSQVGFTGPVSVTGGTLKVLGSQALGTTTTGTTVTSGATLDINGTDLGAELITVTGSGTAGQGAIVNTGSNSGLVHLHRVTLAGPATIGGTSRMDFRSTGIVGESLDLAGFKLTKVGSNQVGLIDIGATNGDIEINAGIFSIENNATVHGSGAITINSGGTLGLWTNQPGRLTRGIVANGGALTELGSGLSTSVHSPITLQANLTYTVFNGSTVVTQYGNIVESGGSRVLTKAGDGRLILLGSNVWTGGFQINGGTVMVNNSSGSGTGVGNVTIGSSGRLAGNGIVGTGVGSILVSLSGRLAPGSDNPGALRMNLGTGNLNVSSAVTADATAALQFDLGSSSDSVVFLSGNLAIGTSVLEFDDFSFTPTAGFQSGDYLLFDGITPITGSLGPDVSGSMGGGFTGTLQVADGGRDILLHVVPEPACTATLLCGICMLCAQRRRQVAT